MWKPYQIRQVLPSIVVSTGLLVAGMAAVPAQASASPSLPAAAAADGHQPVNHLGAKFTADNQTGEGWFGFSAALSADGGTALIGGPFDSDGTGAVWVFTRSHGSWIHGPKLTPNDENGRSEFGQSMALSADGNTALVGGPADHNRAGAVWVFTRSRGTWVQGAKLTPDDENGDAEFGRSVALSADGRTALIGGHVDNNLVGAAWVFTRSCGAWAQQGRKLVANDETGIGEFGFSVALSADGNTALIGGDRDNDYVGAVWVFTRSRGTWSQQGSKLTANDEIGPATFGLSVQLSANGRIALIGGPVDSGYTGAAWVFIRTGGTWIQRGPKLTASDGIGPGQFGASGALSADGSIALIGGREDANSTGAVWTFTRVGRTWTQQGPKITATDETAPGYFGWSVALSTVGNVGLIGGPADSGFQGAAWGLIRASR